MYVCVYVYVCMCIRKYVCTHLEALCHLRPWAPIPLLGWHASGPFSSGLLFASAFQHPSLLASPPAHLCPFQCFLFCPFLILLLIVIIVISIIIIIIAHAHLGIPSHWLLLAVRCYAHLRKLCAMPNLVQAPFGPCIAHWLLVSVTQFFAQSAYLRACPAPSALISHLCVAGRRRL